MYRLRRSRFMKLIAGLLIVVLCCAVVGNIVGTYILMEENLYYASRQQLQQKIYSYVYEYTASDLMRYLKAAEKIYTNNKNYINYNLSELELFREKYAPRNSNIHFVITDDTGNILLKNENTFFTDNVITFTSDFGWDYDYSYDGYFSIGGSDKSYIGTTTTMPFVSGQSETLTTKNHTSDTEEITETTTLNENNGTEKPAKAESTAEYKSEVYEVNNDYSGMTVKLIYLYNDKVDNEILIFVKDHIKQLPCDITEITVCQDEFIRSYYDDTQDGYEIVAVYNPVDNSVPERSFSTTLLTGDRKIPVTYSYNGSFSFLQFGARLKNITLAALNSDNEDISFSVRQKEGTQLRVTVSVPCYTENATDIYYYAEKLVDFTLVYKNNIIAVTVADFILFIASLVFIFWSAGFVPKRDEPKAGGLHAIPFDLYLFLSVLAGIGCLLMINENDELFILTGFTGLAILIISLIYTIPVRVRTKALTENTVIDRVYRAVKHAAAVTDEATGSKLTIGIVLFSFVIITATELIIFLGFNNNAAALLTFIARITEIPFIIFILIALTALHNGARAISKGDTGYRINSGFLFGAMKRHAEYLNHINDGVNKAVEERMKSESLKTELITNVSHDLKTPLTSIVNYIDLLKKTDVKDEKAAEYIEVIDRQAQRLKKLTIDIVEASKAATGNVEVNCENTALNVILLQTNGEYIEKLEASGLTLIQEIPDEEISISTDGRLLWRIIDNLMNNICKYSMPGTRVYLTLWKNNGRAFISFRNISRNKLNITPENLTERFVRGDSSRNTEGSGLGLSIANSLTEVLGGKLSIIIDGDLFKVTLSFPVTTEQK